MARAQSRHRSDVLDFLILGAAALHLGSLLVLRYALWADVEATLAASVAEFAHAFGRFAGVSRALLIAVGTVTTVLVVVALVREAGGLRAWRGRLRIAAVVVLVCSGVFGGAVLEPIERAILDAAAAGTTDGVAPLVARWGDWQPWLLAAAVVSTGVLVAAHRAPRVRPAPGTIAAALTPRHRTLLVLLGAATLFEGYDRFIVSLALPYIARDLGAAEGDLGWALSAIRVGALLAIVLGWAGDRFGRRRLLLLTIVAYTLATAATGFSRALVDFVVFQIVAVAFLSAELSLAQVVIAEEFPARARGMGQGLLGAAGAIGAGMAAILFPLMEATPLGWRGLYFVGILPLLLVTYLRRQLPETERWRQLDRARVTHAGILGVLAPAYRRRFAVLMVVTASATAAAASAFGFASYRATTAFGQTPGQVSAMILTGGGLGFWGWMIFGRLADVLGRRPTGAVALIGGGGAIAAFYETSYLLPAFTGIVFFEAGVSVAINALSTEIFPTALRATAKAWVTNAAVLGAMAGLATVGALAGGAGGHAAVIAALALLPVLLAPALFLLPETHRRELEVTSG